MKKLILSILSVVLAIGLVGGGALAYFRDTEASNGNTFTAGILDLAIDISTDTIFTLHDDPLPKIFDTLPAGRNIAPGDKGEVTLSLHLKPDSLNADLWMQVIPPSDPVLFNHDFLSPEPEISGDDAISDHIKVNLWIEDATPGFQGGEQKLYPMNTEWGTMTGLIEAGPKHDGKLPIAYDVPNTDPYYVGWAWEFENVGNEHQGDSCNFDIIFGADQVVRYSLSTSTVGNGSITLSPPGGSYPLDTTIQLTADADPGWTFGSWSGDTNTNSITMNGNKTVTATFKQINHMLSSPVSPSAAETAGCTVTGNSGSYHYNDSVSLTEHAENGWAFSGWTSTDISLTGHNMDTTLTFNMPNSAATVTATFVVSSRYINASAGTGGSISPSGLVTVNDGADQTFTISATSGYRILDVVVDDTARLGAVTSHTFTGVTTDHTILATFQKTYTLTTSAVGIGSVGTSPVSNPDGSYDENAVVTLTASTTTGQFLFWGGDASGSTNPTTVTMTASKSVTGYFNTFGAEEDAQISYNNGDQNYGSEQTMRTGGDGSNSERFRSLIDLDLTSIPSSMVITSAQLSLYCYNETSSGSSTIGAYRIVGGSWEEASVTANNQPAGSGTATDDIYTNNIGWKTWDVTSDVRDFVSGTVTNDGWKIRITTGDTYFDFRTKEYTDSTYRPQLVITYAPGVTLTTHAGTGGASVSPSSGTYALGVSVDITANAAPGHSFVNWSGDTDTIQDVADRTTSILMNSNKDITANFAPNTYTVTFNPNGGSTPSPSSKSVTFGSAYGTLATTSRTGYTLVGWFTTAGGGTEVTSSTTVTNASNHTLYAHWTGNPYTVTFDSNDGSAPSPSSKSVTFGSTYGSLASASRTGYTLAGWFTAASGGTQVTTSTTVTNASDHTIYAHWTAGQYTVTFNSNGGGSPTPASKSVTFGSTYGSLASASRTGYTLAGWFTEASGGTQITSSTPVTITSAQTLYAQWTANTYTVTFDSTGGGTANPTSKTVSFGSTYGALAAVARTGYTFAGWFTAASGGALVSDTTTVGSASNHTLYAQWIATVSFNRNGGGTEASPAALTTIVGGTVALPTPPTKTGYNFASWNTAANGSGSTFTASTVVNGNITVYAQWSGSIDKAPSAYFSPGSGAWNNPSRVYIQDGDFATAYNDGNNEQYGTFSFGIPTDARITGIQVSTYAYTSRSPGTGSGTIIASLSWNGGSNYSATRETTTNIPESWTSSSVGGSTDTWGSHLWTAAELNSTDFRLRLEANNIDSNEDLLVDYAHVTVYYAFP